MTRRHRIQSAAVAGALSVVTVGAILAPAASASSPTCFGKKPTAPVLTKNNKTLKGTKGNDVLIATGKNDTITGGDGKDRICGRAVKLADGGAGDDQIQITSGKAKGGVGNDKLTQTSGKTGKVSFDGGPGTDTLTLGKKASAGSTADGGADADKITVPGSLLNVKVPHTSGDVLNGFVTDVLAPATGGPLFEAAVNNTDLGGAPILVEGLTPDEPLTDQSTDDELSVESLRFAAGRTPGTWAVNFGDGDVRTGAGVPPENFRHSYAGNATHTLSVTITDNLGATTTQSGPVTSDATQAPSLSLGASTVPNASDPKTVSWPLVTQTPQPGITFAAITSYLIEFGDGTQQVGTTPPSTVTHTYPAQAHFTPTVSYEYTLLGESDISSHTQASVAIGSGSESYLSISVTHGDRRGTSAQTIETGQLLSVNLNEYDGPETSVSLNPGIGGPPYLGDSTSFSYPAPGTYTLTATVKATGQPDKVATLPITVRDAPAIDLAVPLSVEEGPVTVPVSGSVPAGAKAYLRYFGHDDARPVTALPASITPVMSATYEGVSAGVFNDPLPLTDTTTLQFSSSTETYPQVTTRGILVDDVEIDTTRSYYDYYYGGAFIAARPDAIEFRADVAGAAKTKVVSETVDAGNGVIKTSPGDVLSRYPNPLQLAFGAPADHQIVVSAQDSAGRKGRAFSTLSTAGAPTVTSPTTTQAATAGTPVTLTGVTAAIGANAKALAWSVDWDDATNPDSGYGPLPAVLTHTYAASESGNDEDVSIYILDDHGQSATGHATIHVA